MLPGLTGRHASPRGAHQEAEPDEEGLRDLLDGFGLLPHTDRQGRQTDGPPTELGADRLQDGAVEAVEPQGIEGSYWLAR